MGRALGIAVSRDRSSHITSPSQEFYMGKLITRAGLENTYPVTTPLAPGAILSKFSA
jgi:hypothetical protein